MKEKMFLHLYPTSKPINKENNNIINPFKQTNLHPKQPK